MPSPWQYELHSDQVWTCLGTVYSKVQPEQASLDWQLDYRLDTVNLK